MLLGNDVNTQNSPAFERVGIQVESLVEADSGGLSTGINRGHGALIDQLRIFPNLQSLFTDRGFGTDELALDPDSEFSPSTRLRSVLMQHPNLHISIEREDQLRAHRPAISEGWPQDLAARFHL